MLTNEPFCTEPITLTRQQTDSNPWRILSLQTMGQTKTQLQIQRKDGLVFIDFGTVESIVR